MANGADGLKLFPAEQFTPAVIKAWRAVFPKQTRLFPVGGITPDTMQSYRTAGADGFGLGSALYKPGDKPAQVAVAARSFVTAWNQAGRT